MHLAARHAVIVLPIAAGLLALGVAWQPGSAEGVRALAAEPSLPVASERSPDGSIDCTSAVWPYVAAECLRTEEGASARKVRRIILDEAPAQQGTDLAAGD